MTAKTAPLKAVPFMSLLALCLLHRYFEPPVFVSLAVSTLLIVASFLVVYKITKERKDGKTRMLIPLFFLCVSAGLAFWSYFQV